MASLKSRSNNKAKAHTWPRESKQSQGASQGKQESQMYTGPRIR